MGIFLAWFVDSKLNKSIVTAENDFPDKFIQVRVNGESIY